MENTKQTVAIVTGASSGIGLGVTQALLQLAGRDHLPQDKQLEGPQAFA